MTPERWREVDAVVRGALATPPEARAVFVTEACRGDPGLRREVEELLAIRTGDFLERPAAEAFVAGPDQPLNGHVSAPLGGRYVLGRELGRGGMASVYLARDLQHDRSVAVKVLHAELAAVVGPTRFLTEIRTTAALQHPHILPLFDSGSTDGHGGLLYYVMPYVAGETLRARLAREGQLSVAEALRIASEVASALEYAHRHGVIHRDIKPENILLDEEGHALVADFGIALAITNAGGERLTQSGLSLGTPQYMPPEQAAGNRSVDGRADIYALGAVTYEMLGGEPPFTGPTIQAIMARVMTESPRPLAVLRPSVPQPVCAAVHVALEKVPADRYASASSFAAALASPSPELDQSAPTIVSTARPMWVGVSLGAMLLIVGWAVGRWGSARESAARARAAGQPNVRLEITLDSGSLEFYSDPAISPDGRTIVYAADGPDGAKLYARRLDQRAARPLTGTDDATQPFFSPDGAWVGFFSHGALRKTRLEGGAPLVLYAVRGRLAHAGLQLGTCGWGRDDVIVCGAIDETSASLLRLRASGGKPDVVHLADTTVVVHAPHPLPGGRAILVTVADGPLPTQGRVGVLDLATGRVRQLVSGQGARYAGGAIFYATPDGKLLRQPFDLEKLELGGSAEEVANDVETFYAGRPGFDVSDAGALVYWPSTSWLKLRAAIKLMDRSGRREREIAAPMAWVPRFSPDGKRVAYGALAPGQHNGDVWITDLVAGTTQRVTTDDKDANDPQWSPDGKQIVYSVDGSSGTGKHLVVRTVDGEKERSLPRAPGTQWPSDWTPDGRSVLFTDSRDSIDAAGEQVAVQEIWVARLDGSPPRPYLTSPAHERGARLSPDGLWAAYVSDETGHNEVYVQSYPTPGHKLLVSVGGGYNPIWRREGRELYYWQSDQLFAVTFDGDGVKEPLKPRPPTFLFRAPYTEGTHANYDVSPDGKRFALITGSTHLNRLVVALNASP